MKVICFNGNLGNQVFYCAFKDYLKRKYNEDVYYYVLKGCPRVSVEQYFNLELPKKSKFVDILSTIVFYGEIALRKILKLKLPQKLVCGRGEITESSIFFSNYIQDKFFYENLDSSWLTIKMPQDLSSEYKSYANEIISRDSIAIHIRRGDYVKPGSVYADLSSTDYYDKAIKVALEKYPNAHLYFFSDDLEFVKAHFDYANAHYVDCNRGADSYLDISLMSLAKVNIMANSTFSYWGAYMGHERKLVIYPKMWFIKSSNRSAPKIMLDRDNWIGI